MSPSNIICSYAGEVKLCDFGIAKATLSRVTTKTGVIKGKVKYMSPEQALGRKLDHRSDVFSLGSCLYEMLTRIPPFTALERDGPPDQGPRREVPAGQRADAGAFRSSSRQITDKCLTRSRANRYQTAAEAEGDLRAFLRKFMPNYSRSHLGRFIRKMFATEIERELRMLEEYVLTDEMSDDVGENLLGRDEDFEPPDVPFQPKPTSVSIVAAGSTDFSSDSNFTTMPKVDRHEDIHNQNTLILDGRGRNAPQPHRPAERKGRTQPPPPPRSARQPIAQPSYDDDVHSQPTMIIDLNRTRGRGRG